MNNDDEREDLLSILRRYRPVYFAVFIVQVITWCVIVYWWESTSGEHTTDTIGRMIATGLKMAPLTGLSVITTIVLVEIGEVSNGSFANTKYPTKNRGKSHSTRA